jgi:hypothetical protein
MVARIVEWGEGSVTCARYLVHESPRHGITLFRVAYSRVTVGVGRPTLRLSIPARQRQDRTP